MTSKREIVRTILEQNGFGPGCDMGQYVALKTPFRPSHSSSFIAMEDSWCDKGMKDENGEHVAFGGDYIQFAILVGIARNRTEAFRFFEEYQNGFIDPKSVRIESRDYIIPSSFKRTSKGEDSYVDIIHLSKDISTSELVTYLSSLQIPLPVAGQLLKQCIVRHHMLEECLDPALYFPNKSGGCLLFTQYETFVLGPSDYTVVKEEGSSSGCLILTDVFDCLSLLTLFGSLKRDIYILNNYFFLERVLQDTASYKTVDVLLRQNTKSLEMEELATRYVGDKGKVRVGFNGYNSVVEFLKLKNL